MPMTTAQLATLKTDIQSRANLWTAGHAVLSDVDIAAFYNLPSVPALSIWRPVVTVEELNAAIDWAIAPALTTPFHLTWQSMIWTMWINMTDAQVRAGVKAVWGNNTATENAILATGAKPATYLEALFSTGGGVTKISKQFFGVLLQPQDVTNALSV